MPSKNSDASKRNAAYLRSIGIYHGKRRTSTLAPPVPPIGEAGSAAYRRLMSKLKIKGKR